MPIWISFGMKLARSVEWKQMTKHILVVDDEEQVRHLLGVFLREAGYQVSEASDGEQAVRLVKQKAPDLVVLDLVMPEKEGAETVMDMRRLHPELPVLAISGVVGAEFYLHAAKLLGASATLRKPFTREQLLEAVESLLTVAE